MGQPMNRFAYLLPLIAGACWGCTGIFVRTLDDAGLDNITITFSRVGVMFLMLLLATVVYDRNLLRIKRRDLLLLAVIGVDGLVLMNICYNISNELCTINIYWFQIRNFPNLI